MSNTDKLRQDIISKLATVTRDLSLFSKPTPDQRQAKERFWGLFMEGDMEVPAQPDLAAALRFGQDKRISGWWDIPGFQDWFLNKQEFKDRVEFMAHLALDGIQDVLLDKTATPASRVAAAKLALEVANKLPKAGSNESRYLDEKINEMDSKELERFIQSKLIRFPSEKSLTTDDNSAIMLEADK
jgi:hypothetical protein